MKQILEILRWANVEDPACDMYPCPDELAEVEAVYKQQLEDAGIVIWRSMQQCGRPDCKFNVYFNKLEPE